MKKFENYVSNLRVLERADEENLVKRILEKYIPQFLELERELKRVYGDIL